MEQKKFEAVLKLLIPQVIHLITEKKNIDEVTASRDFYNSKVYELLENENTKLLFSAIPVISSSVSDWGFS